MPGSGGTTTQSGILYQNSIAALYLGRMCDAAQRSDCDRVNEVRVEAPEYVDDTVVTFADDHRGYIQAKESIRVEHEAWRKLWHDFDAQFRKADFRQRRDRLMLYAGDAREEHRDLKEACLRSGGAQTYEEWWSNLSEKQKALIEKIKPRLSPETLEESILFTFFGHIDVVLWSLEEIERDKVRDWMPAMEGGKLPKELFRLLRDRVGAEARRRGTFTLVELRKSLANEGYRLAILPDIASLREAVRRCRAPLLQHKHTIARVGMHIRRGVVDDILTWALDSTGQEKVAMFLDRAGMGKSVVIRDVLVGLEEVGGVVLAVKADQQFSGVNSHDDLQAKLGLPEPVEHVVGRLAVLGPVAVLVDQIDALSLSLARDQKALDVVLEMVARLRLIPGVRILISCRSFDRNGDPRLRNIEVKKEFALQEWSDSELEMILSSFDFKLDDLSPATRKLLRVPLHLDLFARVVEGQGTKPRDSQIYRGLGSLQDLYALVWDHVVLKPEPDAPPAHERLEVLGLITDRMYRDQRTTVPVSMFTTFETSGLERAVRWLASAGILVVGQTELGLLHQTFFDYCYARRFVEAGRRLVPSILESDQGLQIRPLLVQVLSYLRGSVPRVYLAELRDLFDANGLRFHLQDLLIRWFGSLPEPTDGEWTFAYRRLIDPTMRGRLLSAMGGNADWFARIKGAPLEALLALDDQTVDTDVIPYLISMLSASRSVVVEIARRLSCQGGAWTIRAARVVSMIRDWRLSQASELFERLATTLDPFLANQSFQIAEIAKEHPLVGCRLIRRRFDQVLQGYRSQDEEQRGRKLSLTHELENRTGLHHEALGAVARTESIYFVDCMLPWLTEVIVLTAQSTDMRHRFFHDELCRDWHDHVYVVQHSLISALVAALCELARSDLDRFRLVASRLAGLPFLTPQTLLARVYQSEPELLAANALDFLQGDRRRLDLGDYEQYESRQLLTAIYPFLNEGEREKLEGFIIDNPRPIGRMGLHGLRTRGLDQLFLLQAIPAEYLSQRGLNYLDELKRKFPGLHASDDPRTIHFSRPESPIPPGSTEKMSDRAWLRAMQKFRGRVRFRSVPREGARELGDALLKAVKGDPERFSRLAARAPDAVIVPYAGAILNGLAESSCSSERVFDLAGRLASVSDSNVHHVVASALRKRVESGLPDDLIATLETWVRNRTIPANEKREDPDDGYLESIRGTSFGTLMRALDQKGTAEAKEHKWMLIEFVASDPSTSLRAGAIHELLNLIGEDRDRSMALFERTMDGHAALLRSATTQDFLYYGFYKHFGRIRPFISALMNEADEEAQQRGAELACIAAISPHALESSDAHAKARQMAEEAITGPASWRRGAAHTYAANLSRGSLEEHWQYLNRLLNDEDEGVRNYVATLFNHLRGDHLVTFGEYLGRFVSSRSLHHGMQELAQYLWEHGFLEPTTTLSLIRTALDNPHGLGEQHRHFSGEEFVRVVLRIYADPGSTDAIRRSSMDVFDRLMDSSFPEKLHSDCTPVAY